MPASQINHMAMWLTPWTARRVMVRNIAPFIGRTIPMPGVIILSADVSQIIFCTIRDDNAIARGDDKIW
ncbi:hypothetical protein FZI19_04750 [Cronobacter muytjensii]|uniref:Uncharacterized protein n=1 Tax=Cronobacter muytjensii TaxID=413501 RepID=A0A2T7AXE0_9ENTR|nr:hypothetical protein FZI19_04750 [Cronobacter muytjensii]PUX16980.1 hypothetical protein AUN14_05025 [Cronobacter muytjensii]